MDITSDVCKIREVSLISKQFKDGWTIDERCRFRITLINMVATQEMHHYWLYWTATFSR